MALALPLLAGFVLAPLFGGRWSRLGKLRMRAVWLFYVAIALQLVAFPVKVMPWHTSDRIGVVLWLVSYALFASPGAGNARVPRIPPIAPRLLVNPAPVPPHRGPLAPPPPA